MQTFGLMTDKSGKSTHFIDGTSRSKSVQTVACLAIDVLPFKDEVKEMYQDFVLE